MPGITVRAGNEAGRTAGHRHRLPKPSDGEGGHREDDAEGADPADDHSLIIECVRDVLDEQCVAFFNTAPSAGFEPEGRSVPRCM